MNAVQKPFPGADSGGGRRRLGAAFILGLLGFLLAYTAWVWAGLRPSMHWAAVAAAGLLLPGVFVVGRAAAWRAIRRDPVFYLGLAFLGFLVLQWANAGRGQYFDVGYQRWMFMPPKWPGWPSAFSPAEAMQMLAWFFPAWVMALAIRAPLLERAALRSLMRFIACNAGLLALFGLVQYWSGTRSMYWRQPWRGRFFASFAYSNHAAPYFLLAGALAAGLLYGEVFDASARRGPRAATVRIRHPGRIAALIPAFLLCLAGANLGLSRSGVILAWTLALFAGGCGAAFLWRRLPPAARLNLAALSLAAAGVLYFVVAGFGAKAIQKEFTLKATAAPGRGATVREHLMQELGVRPQLAHAAVSIWRSHPWAGVGGWGFKYLLAEQMTEETWRDLRKGGWANVHFDFLQFLAEFGIVGMSFLLGALGTMVSDLFRPSCRRDVLWAMGGMGLGLVLASSVIDLPFRCPAILYAWVAVLAALPAICRISSPPGPRPAGAAAFPPYSGRMTTMTTLGEYSPERTGP